MNREILAFKRKRQKKTDYRKRLRFLKSREPRVVLRKSNYSIITQLVEYNPKGDKVIFTINSKTLDKLGWNYHKNNIPSAYLTGLLFGKTAIKKGYKKGIIDLGLRMFVKGGFSSSFIKGLVDSGFNVPHSDDIYPSEDRITGKHIEQFALNLKKNDPKKYERQFSDLIKKGVTPENISKDFEKVKKTILAGDIQ